MPLFAVKTKNLLTICQEVAFQLVPGARVELAWISPNDFESFASTIPPAGQLLKRSDSYYICLLGISK